MPVDLLRANRRSPPALAAYRLVSTAALATGLWATAADTFAADAKPALYTRQLAATCAQCHGTDGRAVPGEALIRLAGLDRDYLLSQLLAFRTGQRPATIMHQITRGYSQEQLEEIATYFSTRK